VPDCAITGIEIDPDMVALARQNVLRNLMDARLTIVEGDALGPELRGDYHHAFANPPFHGDDGQQSPNESRERAKRDAKGLGAWIEAGLKRTRPRGTMTLVFRADRLREVLAAAPLTGVSVFPLWPREGEEAKRVIVQILKNSSAPLQMLSGLVLHEADGRYTPKADAVLKGEASLEL
jgi:tRNA1(Val) A37 N6-methylase TrmN6